MAARKTFMSEAKNPPLGPRAYRRPVLAVYGAVHDRTLSNVADTMNDKGNGSQSMT